jgi:hypothetical protein
MAASLPDFAIARKIDRNDIGLNAVFRVSPNTVRIAEPVRSGSKALSTKRTTAAEAVKCIHVGECGPVTGGAR